MLFSIGALFLCLGIIYFLAVFLAVRNPMKQGWFTADWMVNGGHIFFIMGFLIAGISLMIKGLIGVAGNDQLILDGAVSVVLLVATVLIIKAMHIKKRLASYEKLKTEMGIEDDTSAPPPKKGEDTTPPLPKAA